LAKIGTSSPKSGQSSGKVQADPLQRALEVIGRRPHPLDPDVLAEHDPVLKCPAIVARAGFGASPHEVAQAASDVLREIITEIRDDTDRRVAEAAFAVDEDYEGKNIEGRQELLYERYGITKDMYAEHRKPAFWKVTFRLRLAPSQAISVVHLHPMRVAETATLLYYASIATRVLIADRLRLLGDDALLVHEPNLPLYSAHITFLLTAHRYLHTIDAFEDMAKPELTRIFQQVVTNSPLQDIIYLAHIYGGRDRPYYPPGADQEGADRLLRTTWKKWYERQESADVDTELHSLCMAVLEFRNTIPMVPPLDPLHPIAEDFSNELQQGTACALKILRDAATFEAPARQSVESDKSSSPVRLSYVLKTQAARDAWLLEIEETIKTRVVQELENVKAVKQWDTLIAEHLHSDG
jgi:hypothetical protein